MFEALYRAREWQNGKVKANAFRFWKRKFYILVTRTLVLIYKHWKAYAGLLFLIRHFGLFFKTFVKLFWNHNWEMCYEQSFLKINTCVVSLL